MSADEELKTIKMAIFETMYFEAERINEIKAMPENEPLKCTLFEDEAIYTMFLNLIYMLNLIEEYTDYVILKKEKQDSCLTSKV